METTMKRVCTAAAAMMVLAFVAKAQQTIFNVPSADLTPKGSGYFEQESQFRAWAPGQYWHGTDYFAYGLSDTTEANVNLYNTSVPAGNIAVGLGLRSVFKLFGDAYPDREFKVTVGGQMLISAQGQGIGYWAYAHGSGRVPKLKTRLTAGMSSGTRQLFGETTRLHFISGVEQPLSGRVTLMADWFSGGHALGFLTSGFSVALNKTTGIFLGYQRPNNETIAGRSGLTLELTKIF
jgi:hypothetical protein